MDTAPLEDVMTEQDRLRSLLEEIVSAARGAPLDWEHELIQRAKLLLHELDGKRRAAQKETP